MQNQCICVIVKVFKAHRGIYCVILGSTNKMEMN